MAKPASPSVSVKAEKKPIKLALQGGGAHGAFTWGVLDAMLEDGRLDIQAISGASAGAMNAVVLADGLLDGSPDHARRQLESFWRKASLDGGLPGPARRVFDTFLSAWGLTNKQGNPWFDMFTAATSPYDFNPLNINPLRAILDNAVDFARLRAHSPMRLHIAATNVETGKVRIFRDSELTADHVCASACLPLIFQAVVIDGKPFWDGGYVGNPPLYPLFDGQSRDLLLVQINPVARPGTPQSAVAIQNRLNEISFNAPLLHELRAIDFVTRLIEAGQLNDPRYKRILMHRIAMSDSIDETASSKSSTGFDFFIRLRNAGRKAARDWLKQNFDAIGTSATMDLRAEFS